MDNLVITMLIVTLIIYVVLIPLAKRRNMRKAQIELQKFYDELVVGDKIVLSDGIKGEITEKINDLYKVRIAKNVEVELNKFGIVNKLGDNK